MGCLFLWPRHSPSSSSGWVVSNILKVVDMAWTLTRDLPMQVRVCYHWKFKCTNNYYPCQCIFWKWSNTCPSCSRLKTIYYMNVNHIIKDLLNKCDLKKDKIYLIRKGELLADKLEWILRNPKPSPHALFDLPSFYRETWSKKLSLGSVYGGPDGFD